MPPTQLPPSFLLPLRLRLHLSTVSTTAFTTDPSPPPGSYTQTQPSDTPKHPVETPLAASQSFIDQPRRQPQLSRRSPLPRPTKPLQDSLSLLPLLASQAPHYVTAHIHARPYLLTLGDTLRLPFHMQNAPPGTVLRLNRASLLGSREFTFRGDPWISEKYFCCRATVVGVEGEPMRRVEKTKRRQRKVKTTKSKMRFTVLRITELRVLPEGMDEGEEVSTEAEIDVGS